MNEVDSWAGFYAAMRGRRCRAPFDAAVAQAEQRRGGPGVAADIGCGDGTETRVLLARGWQVLAVDSEPAAAAFVRAEVPAADAPRLSTQTAAFTGMQLPALDLAWAGMSLPFCAPADLDAVWQRIVAALVPGGCFAGHFFGPRDTWASEGGELGFHDEAAVRILLAGFEVVICHEREWDGGSGAGPKHWHLFEVVAFRR